MVIIFYNKLSNLADKHAPMITKNIRPNDKSPWFDTECARQKCSMRAMERRWRANRSPENKLAYSRSKRVYQKLCQYKLNNFWHNKLTSTANNNKWPLLQQLLFRKAPNQNHDHSAEDFANFFESKIDNIRSAMAPILPAAPTQTAPPQHDLARLNNFELITAKEITDRVRAVPNKQCHLDPIPMSVLKCCIETLAPFLSSVVNACLQNGIMPQREKCSYITPLLKKSTLDPSDLSNFRPISNLSIVSKLIEHCVIQQLFSHFNRAPLPECQSAYRPNHSTETALLRFFSDVRSNMAQGEATAAVTLDLSAAFDTVDHNIFLRRLQQEFNIGGHCADWFSSYLSDRYQYVRTPDGTSNPRLTKHGLPQGSGSGPVGYNTYTSPLPAIVAKYDFSKWLECNMMCLNPTKTELIVITTHHNIDLIDLARDEIRVNGHMVQPSESIKFLGVTIDKHLSLKSNISQLSRTCMWQLKEIRRLRQRLDRGTTETLIRSFITSRIDYCNAIFFGLPATTLLPLKRILHTAARIIAVQRRYDHITPTMMALHWLPIRQRIAYKTACLVYRCLNGTAPTYLANQLTICDSQRLYNQRLLVVPFRQTNGFESSGPHIWNSLPQALRTADQTLSGFKVRLKTFLFQQAYIS